MIECLILGDSIAQGIAHYRQECKTLTQTGITSKAWNTRWITQNLQARTVIISLGSNDYKGIKTRQELESLRELTKAEGVFWILPCGNNPKSGVEIKQIQNWVLEIAQDYKDFVLTIQATQLDKVHPTQPEYKRLANQTK
jgi:lysophospholipase L1-like esterase